MRPGAVEAWGPWRPECHDALEAWRSCMPEGLGDEEALVALRSGGLVAVEALETLEALEVL